jgi:uncharacterized protein (DUF1697 family)
MAIYIALLRGINVGGQKMVAMTDLRDLLTRLGFTNARSLLQSGNLLFQSKTRTSESLELLLESETEKRLGVQSFFFVRTTDEWRDIVARNPFREEAKRDPAHLVVMLLKGSAEAKDVKALQAANTGPEIIRADARRLYIVYPEGMGRSRLTNALIERKLGTRGTARNWNTVLKLDALSADREDA